MKLDRKQKKVAAMFEEITGFEMIGIDGRETFDEVLWYNFAWLRKHIEEQIHAVEQLVQEDGP